MSGMPKAADLPLPVSALARTSRPAERRRDRRGLDRGRLGEAEVVDGAQHSRAQIE